MGITSLETSTFVHGLLQLLPSFDSVMTAPVADVVELRSVLSAQTRTDRLPAEVNVYKGEATVLFAPLNRAGVELDAKSVIEPRPSLLVATWKK